MENIGFLLTCYLCSCLIFPFRTFSSKDSHQSLRPESMFTGDLAAGSILLLQTVFGMLGNFSLLYCYLFLYCTGDRLRTVDLIVTNLIVANIFILLSAGFCSPMTDFGWSCLKSGSACRVFAYLRGVGRGVSIGITCILSVFQDITISPRNSRWADLKVKALKCIVPSIVVCWVMNMILNTIYPIFVIEISSNKSITNRKSFIHCSAVPNDRYGETYAVMMSMPVVFFFCHDLGQWLHGFHPVQAQAESPKCS